MATITIPKIYSSFGDLVAIPRAKYEEYQQISRVIKVEYPSKAERRSIDRGLAEIREGKHKPWLVVKNELARRSR